MWLVLYIVGSIDLELSSFSSSIEALRMLIYFEAVRTHACATKCRNTLGKCKINLFEFIDFILFNIISPTLTHFKLHLILLLSVSIFLYLLLCEY